jgi:hypothetical protein
LAHAAGAQHGVHAVWTDLSAGCDLGDRWIRIDVSTWLVSRVMLRENRFHFPAKIRISLCEKTLTLLLRALQSGIIELLYLLPALGCHADRLQSVHQW